MTNTSPDKLYIAVRADLTPGLQAAQVAHAAFHFAIRWPDLTHGWFHDSNYIVVVSVPDELALADLAAQSMEAGIARVLVREPDIGNELTAVALEPGAIAGRLCANMPLALKKELVDA